MPKKESKQVELEGVGPVDMPDETAPEPVVEAAPEPVEPKEEAPKEAPAPTATPAAVPEPTLRDLSEKVDALRQSIPVKEVEKPAPKPEPIDLDKALAEYDAIVAESEKDDADVFELQKRALKQWQLIQRGMREEMKPASEIIQERQAQKQLDAYFKTWGRDDAEDPLAKEFKAVPANRSRELWLEELEAAKSDPYNKTPEAIGAAARANWRNRLKNVAAQTEPDDDPKPGKSKTTLKEPTRITPPGGEVHHPTPPAKESAAQKVEKMLGPVHEMAFDK